MRTSIATIAQAQIFIPPEIITRPLDAERVQRLNQLRGVVEEDTLTEHPGKQAALDAALAAVEAAFGFDLTSDASDAVAHAAAKVAADFAARAIDIPTYANFDEATKTAYGTLVAQAAAVAREAYEQAIKVGLSVGQASVAADRAGEQIKNRGQKIDVPVVVTSAERNAAIIYGVGQGAQQAPRFHPWSRSRHCWL